MWGTEIENTTYLIWSDIVQVRVTIFQVYSRGTISCKTINIIIILCGAYNLQSHEMKLRCNHNNNIVRLMGTVTAVALVHRYHDARFACMFTGKYALDLD